MSDSKTYQSTVATLNETKKQMAEERRAHYDHLTLAREQINQLGALFDAISRQCDEFDPKQDLAAVGQYLSQDWTNLFDCEAEKLKELGLHHG